jgi:O-antigen/teichoic acid export membrane protein
MNETSRTITKNASMLMLSQLITWSLSILVTIFLPRYLGVEAVGQFHLANSVWIIMAALITFGMDIFLVKEIARKPDETDDLFGTSVVLRMGLFILTLAGVIVYVRLVDYSQEAAIVILLIGISTLVWQIAKICEVFLQGLERMEFISFANVAGRVFGTVVTLALLFMGFGVIAVSGATIGVALVSLLILLFFLRRIHPVGFHFNRQKVEWMLRGGFPFLVAGIFLVLYIEIDIIILSLLTDEKMVGWYGSADKLYGTLMFVPMVFGVAIFPALSRLYTEKSDALSRVVSKSFNMLFLLGLPLGLGLMVVANQLVVLLYGPAFANSGPILAVKGIVLTLTYQNMLIGISLYSVDRQKAWATVIAVTALATIPLNLLFIPWAGQVFGNAGIGASLVFIITETTMLVAGLILLPKYLLRYADYRMLGLTLVAGLVMVVVTWQVRDYFIVVPVVVGAVTYGGMILLLRVVPKEDFALLKNAAAGFLARIRRQETEVVAN